MLKQVHFAGIKSLVDVTVDLKPFTMLVGPNGCGKSTLLDQIQLLSQTFEPYYPSKHAFGVVGGTIDKLPPAEVRSFGHLGDMEWIGHYDDVRAEIRIPYSHPVRWYENASVALIEGASSQQIAYTEHNVQKKMEEFRYKLGRRPAQRLSFVPRSIGQSCEVTLDQIRQSGYGVPTVLKDLASNNMDVYATLQQDMRKVVPNFRGIRIGKDSRQEEDNRITPLNTLEISMVGGLVPARQVSDGTLLALAVLTACLNPDLPSLVLIDDIDHGLHLSAQYQIVQAIRRAQERRPELQVICTSHAPILVDAMRPEEVLVMAVDAAGHSHVKPLMAAPDYARWRRGLQSGEIWASLGEDWVLEAPNAS